MRFATCPKVYLIGVQKVNQGEVERFLSDNDVTAWSTDAKSPSEFLIEFGGRLCYMSFEKPRPGGVSAYMDNIKESRHGSVTEHGVYTFVFSDVSRNLTHELVRHRAGIGYSQLSQRYVENKDFKYVLHPTMQKYLREDELSMVQSHLADTMKLANHFETVIRTRMRQAEYSIPEEELTKDQKRGLRKHAKEACRGLLPHGTDTKIQCTMNVRAIRHFIEMRASKHADREIRELARQVLFLMRAECPTLFNDYDDDGTTPNVKI